MKILFVTDSLGLPRPDKKVLASETWCYRVANELIQEGNKEYQFFFCQIGGLHTKELLLQSREGYLAGYDADIIFLQVGIVDCSPRVLPERLKKVISMIPFFRVVVRNFIKRNHKWLSTKIDQSYVSLSSYESNLKTIMSLFPNTKVYALPIAPPNCAYKVHTPLIERNINRYNSVLKNVFGDRFIYNLYKGASIEDIYLEDNHHLNITGHKFVSKQIKTKITELPTT